MATDNQSTEVAISKYPAIPQILNPKNFTLQTTMPPEALKFIQKVENTLKVPIYLVGGAVRDLLGGLEVKDWDFTTPQDPDHIEQAIKNAGKKPYTIGKKFGTVGFKMEIEPKKFEYVEITTFRTEEYQAKNRRPEVKFVTKIHDDLSRRDFTINSLALKSTGKIIDEFGGVEDLKIGTIRAVSNPKTRFKEDPLRILRAIRFAARFGFTIEDKTWEKLTLMKYELFHVSKERWVMELDKILQQENPEYGLDLLMGSGILGVIIPEMQLQKDYDQNTPHHDFDLWTHTKKVVTEVPAENLDLRWAALLHDIAKPFCRAPNKKGYSSYLNHNLLGAQMALKVCLYLKFSNQRTRYICDQIEQHLNLTSDLKIFDDAGKKLHTPNPLKGA